ncbi:hypothetical protein ISF_01568 [Cordyceps fumosorosea ARSEF 2679]|uniref:Imidazoleglycerol-phosphate dehydratase n=1 Tax=Cordyceps fumosorosea (strain ARSEF 2679) TaxID=1081104 RepID=A0A168DE28_CORFA|nr:hypothetical protein ISF_01568 [Cordyceps fumosorosea ARSEF 2679]OAA72495.1 hypothetical protein ISF_01568 [Cordyceps fumosorosea ARSEF 2679]
MPSHSPLKTEEANAASWEAAKGAGMGAAKWGAGAVVLAAIGHVWSPVYRGTTVQFKVFVQMSAMVLGGMIEADHSLRLYEYQMRMQRRVQREQAKWERYQDEFIQANNNKK